MIEILTDLLIKRRNRIRHISILSDCNKASAEYIRVLNTLRENRIMVEKREDGIYIRMAGSESKEQCFSLEWAKVKSL